MQNIIPDGIAAVIPMAGLVGASLSRLESGELMLNLTPDAAVKLALQLLKSAVCDNPAIAGAL